jgi:hypothetical protein
MSHTLTETATFDPTIVVPDGGDSGANRAGDVELIAQRLANRSRALKAVTDQAAVKNLTNTFTQANTFTALTTMQTLHVNSTTEVAGNLWVDSAHDVLYMGAVVTVHKQISIARGAGNVAAGTNVRLQVANPVIENLGAASDGVWFVPIEIPSGCQLVDADVQYGGGGSAGAFGFNIFRHTITDWSANPTGDTFTPIGAGASSIAGTHTATWTLGNYTINNANEKYYLRILCLATFTGGSVWGFRLGFTNYGLNNR